MKIPRSDYSSPAIFDVMWNNQTCSVCPDLHHLDCDSIRPMLPKSLITFRVLKVAFLDTT